MADKEAVGVKFAGEQAERTFGGEAGAQALCAILCEYAFAEESFDFWFRGIPRGRLGLRPGPRRRPARFLPASSEQVE